MDQGLVLLRSPYSVADTMSRLEEVVQRKGLTIVARIDHSGDAAKVGLKLRNDMFIQPIDYFLVGWFILAVASTAHIGWDQFQNNPEPTEPRGCRSQ